MSTSTKRRVASTAKMVDGATAHLESLVMIAKLGDREAIQSVVELASWLANESSLLACMHQEACNEIARGRTSWPLMVGSHKDVIRRALRFVRGPNRLPLGEDTLWKDPPPLPKKSYSLTDEPNVFITIAIQSILMMRQLWKGRPAPAHGDPWFLKAIELPDYTTEKSVRDAWFAAIFEHIANHACGNSVEKDSRLRSIGINEANAKARRGTKSYESHVRSGIKKALRRAFDRMTK